MKFMKATGRPKKGCRAEWRYCTWEEVRVLQLFTGTHPEIHGHVNFNNMDRIFKWTPGQAENIFETAAEKIRKWRSTRRPWCNKYNLEYDRPEKEVPNIILSVGKPGRFREPGIRRPIGGYTFSTTVEFTKKMKQQAVSNG